MIVLSDEANISYVVLVAPEDMRNVHHVDVEFVCGLSDEPFESLARSAEILDGMPPEEKDDFSIRLFVSVHYLTNRDVDILWTSIVKSLSSHLQVDHPTARTSGVTDRRPNNGGANGGGSGGGSTIVFAENKTVSLSLLSPLSLSLSLSLLSI